jgi:hypothetical protein
VNNLKIKSLLIFKELSEKIDAQAIVNMKDHLSKEAQVDGDKIASYLRDGIIMGAFMQYLYDVFDDKKLSAPDIYYTDGFWYWSGDLAYYVEKYNLMLPESFLEHMRQNNFTISNDLRGKEEEFFKIPKAAKNWYVDDVISSNMPRVKIKTYIKKF